MEFINSAYELIREEALVVVFVLLIVGKMLKGTEKVSDKYIPLILLPIGVSFTLALVGFNIDAFIQGVLVTGVSVYAHQLLKQVSS